MSTIESLQDQFGDFAKDIRNNLGNVLSVEGSPGLTQNQIYGIALACTYVQAHPLVVKSILTLVESTLGEAGVNAAKAAATIMAMNNVFYRATHLADDADLASRPTRLRMTVIGNPGVEKVDFELFSLAVSAINGCGACIKSHVIEARKKNVTTEGIHSALRIAAVVQAAGQALKITG